MFSPSSKITPKIDESLTIQLQCFDRRASYRRYTNESSEIGIPREMLVPLLPSGMKQRHQFSALRIKSFDLVCFVIIATLTGKREIFQFVAATTFGRDDVFYGERLW